MIKLIITDYQIIVTLILVLTAWKWGDWKNWKKYHPTILFYAMGDFCAGLVLYNFPLWSFESPLLGKTFSNLLITLVFFPATILLYLPHFPKKRIFQIIYIFLWSGLYTLIEFVSLLLGYFSHFNGWTIWWTFLFNLVMFSIFWVHFKKPLIAILITIFCAIILCIYFKVPLSTIK